jgi:hypothetical protein
MELSPDDFLLFTTRIVVFLLTTACAIHVTRRLAQVKSIELTLLAAVFWFSMIYFIAMVLRTVGLAVPYALGIAIIQASIWCMYWFVHKAFFAGRKSPFKVLIPIALAIAVTLVCIGFVRDATPQGTIAYDQIRWMHTVFSALQFMLGGSCQMVISLLEFNKQRKYRSVLPHVIYRYLFFGLSGILMMAQAVSDVIWTYLDLTSDAGYVIASLFNTLVSLGYSITLFLTWVMPSWFARYLDRHSMSSETIKAPGVQEIEGLSQDSRKNLDKILTSRETMAIIEYLGNFLARAIGRSPAAAKGLLLTALEAEKESMAAPFLSVMDFKRLITRSLLTRLNLLQVPDSANIVKQLEDRMVKDQSLLVMLAI